MSRGHRRYGKQRDGGSGADRFADFNAKDSEEQLALLEVWIEQARASTYEAINSHHRDFVGMRMYGHDPLDEVATLNDKYETVRSRISEDSASDSTIARLDSIGRALRAIVRLAKTHANLKDVDEQILHGEIAVAASSVAEANDLLRELETDCPRIVSAEHVHVLQTQYLKKRAALRAELDYLMAAMYKVSDTGSVCELTVSFSVSSNYDNVPYENPIALSDVFFALTELDVALARDKIDSLAQPLIDRWFVPLLRNPHEALTTSRVKQFASMGIGAYSSGRKGPAEGTGGSPQQLGGDGTSAMCVLVKEKWTRVLMFMCEDMFCDVNLVEDHPELYSYLGNKLWTALCPLLKEALLVPLIPADIAGISDTSAMVPLLELEDAWLELGLIAADALFIKDSIRSLLQIYVSKRRRDLLTVVASVLASDDANTVVVGGDGPVTDILCDYAGKGKNGKKSSGKKSAASGVFGSGGSLDGDNEDDNGTLSFPRCSVSVRAQTLVEFARETIGFTDTEDATAAALYFYAMRDAFALYRCLVPGQSRVAADLLVSPKRAFVLYNDCNYICHHLAGLGFRQRARHWPPLMKASATLVDVIASYRALAKSVLTPLLNRLRDQVRQSLSSSSWMQPKWLATPEARAEIDYEDAERTLALATGVVAQTAQASGPNLPRSTHLKVLGMLSDVVFECVSLRLEEIQAAGDSDARAIVRLVAPAVALQDRFLYDDPAVLGVPSHQTARRIRAPVAKYTNQWERLQSQITRLQTMSDHFVSDK
ncbi:ribosome biogenesis protein ytm1 [Coemansia sp. RSA 1813]|nr:ribosome biogenesis protein ytm1 [Coemansia sp. RSA 1646]KAJ1771768.1 ribosome biogenesis protein ytm1 [Coemansia sp. RSA 1843]KAJ2093407.1 ribosome biogenesis protein ytm1 [Coemansia sp. RSA 986]KAJ2217214.1 ribosome biogenesis protein ytm1 [Coemansia sp. RSA 487]KAJ2572413.1 ribosome biogenesis protein ytm1 [Coemansia sp. RSA 1813]